MYYVLVCPDKYCRGVSIVKDKHKTVQCRSCDSQYKFRKYKKSYETSDKEKAVEARTKLLVKINDSNLDYNEIEEQGFMEDADKVYSNNSEKDTRTPEKIIRDQFSEIDSPTKDKIIKRATKKSKISSNKAEKVLDDLIQNGMVLEIGDEIELL